MANEIYLNIQNDSATSQGITLWQQPAATDVDTNGAIYGYATVPQNNNIGVNIGSSVYNPNDQILYIHSSNTVISKLDTNTNTIVGNPTTTSKFYSNIGNNSTIYVQNNNSLYSAGRTTAFGFIDGIIKFNCTTQVSTNGGMNNIKTFFYNSITNTLFVVFQSVIPSGIYVRVFDLDFNTITTSSTDLVQQFFFSRAFNPDKNVCYLLYSNINTQISVLDTNPLSVNYNTIIATISTGLNLVNNIFYNPNDQNLYVFGNSATFKVYNTNTNSLINSYIVPSGLSTNNVTFDPNGNVFYIENSSVLSQVAVFNAATSSFNGTITFPNDVNSLAINTTTNQPIFINSSTTQTLSFLTVGNTIQTEGTPTYSQLVNSMYGANPYKFTKLYISTTSLQQANQPLTVNLTAPDGRVNTDLKFPSVSPLQRQFVIPEFELNMTANGQSNLQYNVLPNTDVTMIFTYEQPSSAESIEEVEVLYEDVTERFKQLEINKKNNPLLDMKWDIE